MENLVCGKTLGFYFNNLQTQLQICKISNIYCNFKLFIQKCAKQKVREIWKIIIFKKPIPRRIQIFKNICKVFMETGICTQGKLEMCEFSLNAFMQKSMQNIFAKKIVQSASFYSRLSKEL